MPFDAIFMSAVAAELRGRLVGARVEKLHQPEKDELLLQLKKDREALRLLFNVSNSMARVQLTSSVPENPMQPPMLCMLLRKHLTGARVTDVTQEPWDRILRFSFAAVNELYEPEDKQLIIEVLGLSSNILLTAGDGRILAAFKYTELSPGKYRQIQPGVHYAPPEGLRKLPPAPENLAAFEAALDAAPDGKLDSFYMKTIAGLSPVTSRELSFRACGSVDALLSAVPRNRVIGQFLLLAERIASGRLEPVVMENADGEPADYSYMELLHLGPAYLARRAASFSELLDLYYARRGQAERLRRHANDIHKTVRQNLERLRRKLSAQESELSASGDRDKWRIWGELLTANLGTISRGAGSVTVVNYYSETGETVDIPLDVKLSPAANAQRCFTRYRKAKAAEQVLREQIRLGREELAYMESVEFALSQAGSEAELAELRRELEDARYLRRTAVPARRTVRTKPLEFCSSDGYAILVGRSNLQNEELTLRLAERDDYWLHTRDVPGSHVIVRADENGTVPDTTLTEAAMLAAFYSRASGDSRVPVTYTRAKFVKKPAGSRCGTVIYKNEQTAFVTPDKTLPERLRSDGKDGFTV